MRENFDEIKFEPPDQLKESESFFFEEKKYQKVEIYNCFIVILGAVFLVRNLATQNSSSS